ncbi:MAG: chemotaxis protein CheA [Negativicutes bacterium]|nr:chemotaxis protein CheA [Negativicutes bacterium]
MNEEQELLLEFIDEARTHLGSVEENLLKIESSGMDEGAINSIFRSVHTIKGTSGFFGLKKMVELGHGLESLFGEIRSHRLEYSPEIAEPVLQAVDCLRSMLDDIGQAERVDITGLMDELARIQAAGRPEGRGHVTTSRPAQLPAEGKDIPWSAVNPAVIGEMIKFGRRVFLITVQPLGGASDKMVNPQFFQRIAAVGTVIDAWGDVAGFCAEGAEMIRPLRFLFGSVLESDLLEMALGLANCRIEEIPPEELRRHSPKAGELPALTGELADGPKPAGSAADGAGDISFGGEGGQPAVVAWSAGTAADNGGTVEQQPGDQLPPGRPGDVAPPAMKVAADASLRVKVRLLNDLLNISGEMVLNRNQLLRCTDRYRQEDIRLERLMQKLDRIASSWQEKVMETRMQPVRVLFERIPRMVRDLARKLGKEVEIEVEGQDNEVDKSLLETLYDPMVHIVRNSMDHGIEMPAERLKAGKAKRGKIKLAAQCEGGFITVVISDDGRGIDPAKVAAKARDNGLVSEKQLAAMSDSDIFGLIFLPGFSTAAAVSDLSGRGVGMDVVKTNVEKRGGSVEVESVVGQGTTITLILPLTLAILVGLLVRVAGRVFVLPQNGVQEILRTGCRTATTSVQTFDGGASVIRLRGELLPLVSLRQALNLPAAADGEEAAVIVMKIGSKNFGILVDEVIDREQVMVKQLPIWLRDNPCYFAVTILDSGEVTLILNARGLARAARISLSVRDGKEAGQAIGGRHRGRYQFLMFRGAGYETFAVEREMVARVERAAAAEVETVGDVEYITRRGQLIRLVRLPEIMAVSRPAEPPTDFFVVILRRQENIGIVADKIEDDEIEQVRICPGLTPVDGVVGAVEVNKRLALLLDVSRVADLAVPDAADQVPDGEIAALVGDDYYRQVLLSYWSDCRGRLRLAGSLDELSAILAEHRPRTVLIDERAVDSPQAAIDRLPNGFPYALLTDIGRDGLVAGGERIWRNDRRAIFAYCRRWAG